MILSLMQVRAMGSDLQIFVATILLLVPLGMCLHAVHVPIVYTICYARALLYTGDVCHAGNPQKTCVQNLPPFLNQEPTSPVLGPPETNPPIQAIIPQYMFKLQWLRDTVECSCENGDD